MALHIATMSVLAPLAAAFVLRQWAARRVATRELWTATAVQIGTLWFWHMPAAHSLASTFSAVWFLMNASLLTAALWFWFSVIMLDATQRWQGILALLITGKLACLLAALLVFAPRPLLCGDSMQPGALEDQHLAGLLMLTACPASYVLAGLVIAVHAVEVLQPARPRRS